MDQTNDLTGLTENQAKDFLISHVAALKLSENALAEVEAELEKWRKRSRLALDAGQSELIAAAEREVITLSVKRDKLAQETEELRATVNELRRKLPGVAARQRSVDPDLLEQEILMAAGHLPGDEDVVKTNNDLATLERAANAESALAALKAKMGLAPVPTEPPSGTEEAKADEAAPNEHKGEEGQA